MRIKRKDRIEKLGRKFPTTFEEIEGDVDLGLKRGMQQNRLSLPDLKEPLCVNRPVGKDVDMIQTTEYTHDPTKLFKNISKVRTHGMCYKEIPFHTIPQGQLEVSQSWQELTPCELQRISAGPKHIDFETVVLRSRWPLVFSVVNDLS